MSDVNYILQTPEQRKSRRLCHVNMLKEYYEKSPPRNLTEQCTSRLVALSVNVEASQKPKTEDSIQGELRFNNADVSTNLDKKLSHLPLNKRAEVVELIQEFAVLFPDTPGRTTAIQHDIDVGSATSCKQHPYRVNPSKLQHLTKEIVQNNIIERSSSNWNTGTKT